MVDTPQASSSQGKLPSPSSHGTGLVGLTSGSSGRAGSGFSGGLVEIHFAAGS
jgi:hypothetical protein